MTSAKYSVSIPSIAVGTTVAASDAIAFGDFETGMVYIPAGSSITTLTWHASVAQDGTYLAAEDASSAAVTQTVAASQAHPIPAALMGARFLKITGNAAGVVGVTLKD
jgi:hypothetical protein